MRLSVVLRLENRQGAAAARRFVRSRGLEADRRHAAKPHGDLNAPGRRRPDAPGRRPLREGGRRSQERDQNGAPH